MGRTLTKPPAVAPARRRRGDALWRASPFLLLRFRALFAAIGIGALLLALAVAAYPLFTAASASQLFRNAVDRPSITRYAAGLTFTFRDMPLKPVEFERQFRSPAVGALDEPFRELAAESPILGDPIHAILGDDLEVSAEGSRGTSVGRLFSGTGALQQIQVVEGRDGDGVWIPDLLAQELDVGPGDTIMLYDQDGGPTVPVLVDGVYRGFYGNPAGYWFPWSNEFRLTGCFDCPPPPQPIIGDADQVLALLGELGQRSATFRWQAPIADPGAVSIEQARGLEAYQREVGARIRDRQDLGSEFLCCQRWFYGGFVDGRPVNPGSSLTVFASSIGYAVDDAEKRIVSVEGPARVLGIAGVAVALVVIAAAGAFSIRARRVEAAWLFARGTSSAAVGLKTAFESVLPCVVGGILGFGLAVAAVAALGPDGRVDPLEFRGAALATALAVAGAVVLISIVAAWTYVRVVDPHGRRFARLVSLVPWELAIIALAFVALRQLRSGGAFVEDAQLHVVRPSLALVAFPFLLLTGFAILAARLALMGLVWLRGPTASARPAPYLAIRRLAGGGAFVMLLLGAAGLCLGTFLHARIVSTSLGTTVEAKSKVFVGSDVGARIQWTTSAPENFPYPVTRAVEVDGAARTLTNVYDLLAVDPDTLAGAAYWNDGFSNLSIEEIASRLGAGGDGPMPIVVVAGPGVAPTEVQIGTAHVPVTIVGRATSFPGLRSTRPMIVADEEFVQGALHEAGAQIDPLKQTGASTELWLKGDPEDVITALTDAQVPTYLIVTAEQVQDIPEVAAVLDTFVVLNVLGVVAAALTFVGILMYLQARERSGVVSYALSTRMGMSHRQHRRALVLELGAMLLFAVAVGAVLAIAAAWFTVPLLDPIATIPPEPLLVLPAGLLALTAVIAAAFAWLGAAATNRRARRVDLGEVMRVAE
jgi:putative ABC transport system permease protein